jgi:hypothetical protein
MKTVMNLGLYHQYSLSELLPNSLAGKGIVKGSLVLGLLKPSIFLMVLFRVKSVRTYRNGAEHSKPSPPSKWF